MLELGKNGAGQQEVVGGSADAASPAYVFTEPRFGFRFIKPVSG